MSARRIVPRLVAATLLILSLAPAAWAGTTACSDTANVGWSVDPVADTVTGVHVQVPGCADGEWVAIELITDDGDASEHGRLTSEVSDGVADFDVSGLGIRVEPVTGIRVFLLLDGDPVQVLGITVEQRFFASPGNEQNGRRQVTDLRITAGSTYLVPEAPDGYTDVACDGLDFEAPVGVIGQGSGEFTASEPGIHIACYQREPGTPGGSGSEGSRSDEPDEPEVLDESIEKGEPDAPAGQQRDAESQEDVATSGSEQTDDELPRVTDRSERGSADDERAPGDPEALAWTGLNSLGTFLVGAVMVIAGGGLARRAHSDR